MTELMYRRIFVMESIEYRRGPVFRWLGSYATVTPRHDANRHWRNRAGPPALAANDLSARRPLSASRFAKRERIQTRCTWMIFPNIAVSISLGASLISSRSPRRHDKKRRHCKTSRPRRTACRNIDMPTRLSTLRESIVIADNGSESGQRRLIDDVAGGRK